MLIGLFGLPGAGKTFVVNKYIEQYGGEQRVVNLTDRSRTILWYKICFKMYARVTKVLPKYRARRSELLGMLEQYRGKPAKFNTCYIDTYIEAIVLDMYLFDKYRHSRGIYFLDEGILQQLVNISVNYCVEESTLKEVISRLDSDFLNIGIDVTPEVARASIEARNRHVCFIDNLEAAERELFLSSYRRGYEYVKGLCPCAIINRENMISDNIGIIRKFIEENE